MKRIVQKKLVRNDHDGHKTRNVDSLVTRSGRVAIRPERLDV